MNQVQNEFDVCNFLHSIYMEHILCVLRDIMSEPYPANQLAMIGYLRGQIAGLRTVIRKIQEHIRHLEETLTEWENGF